MFAMPIPVPADAPPWLNILLVAGAAAVFVVLVWQAVRYFRQNGGDDEK